MMTPRSTTEAQRLRLFDLKRQYATISSDLHAAIDDVFSTGIYTKGPFVEAFEKSWAEYCGTRFAIGVSCGTAGLELLFRAYGIGPGDEVLVPCNTAIPTAMAVSNVGALPILIDCEPSTANIDPARIEEAITPATKAIVPVHLYGRPAKIDEIVEIARRHKLLVIEDAAQAHGARYRGRRVGALGDAAIFSFHPSKNLGAYGDAGIVTTNDPEIALRVGQLRDIGQSARYTHVRIGTVARLDDFQAAMLSVKLRHLDRWIEGRRRAADRYARAFAGTNVLTPSFEDHEFAVFHLYVVEVPKREQICAALDEASIDWGIHYPTPIHLQEAYRGIDVARHALPVGEARASRILSLPMFAEIEDDEVDRVAEVVLGAL
ncbi:MAG TPA: DegT/DnrJ/EryC1/StrS family aminotransferase [Candidatus Cybelea sp.]|nr:DegT/DnrJ/EryC1/StrS family aminotransferase [Candidatus Cybelea sp.]